MKKLIPMVSLVLWLKEEIKRRINLHYYIEATDLAWEIVTYAEFLKQTLELWVFVPCKLVDGVWVVLEEPKDYEDYEDVVKSVDYDSNLEQWIYYCKEYQQAKERCLFEGFEIIKPSDKCFILLCSNNIKCQFLLNPDYTFHETFLRDETIEDLIEYNLELTKTAQKQIGVWDL